MILLYAHLVLSAFAICMVLGADFAILIRPLSRARLQTTAGLIGWVLAGVWLTGPAVTYIDTGFELAALASRSKLLFKLLCVTGSPSLVTSRTTSRFQCSPTAAHCHGTTRCCSRSPVR